MFAHYLFARDIIYCVMEPVEQPHSTRFLLAALAALALVLGVIFAGLWFFSSYSSNAADEKKLELLAELQVDSDVSEQQRADTLKTIEGNAGAEVSKEEKLNALEALRQQ
jgi:hypothetical protein